MTIGWGSLCMSDDMFVNEVEIVTRVRVVLVMNRVGTVRSATVRSAFLRVTL